MTASSPSTDDVTPALLAARRLSEREAGEYLGLSQRTLQEWRLKRQGPAYLKLGRRIAYDVADLDTFMSANRIEPKAAGGAE